MTELPRLTPSAPSKEPPPLPRRARADSGVFPRAAGPAGVTPAGVTPAGAVPAGAAPAGAAPVSAVAPAAPAGESEPWADADEASWLLKLAKARVLSAETEEAEWRAALAAARVSADTAPRSLPETARKRVQKPPVKRASAVVVTALPALAAPAPVAPVAPVAPAPLNAVPVESEDERVWAELLAKARSAPVSSTVLASKGKQVPRPRPATASSPAASVPASSPAASGPAKRPKPPRVPAPRLVSPQLVPSPPVSTQAVRASLAADPFAPLVPFVAPVGQLVSWPPLALKAG